MAFFHDFFVIFSASDETFLPFQTKYDQVSQFEI